MPNRPPRLAKQSYFSPSGVTFYVFLFLNLLPGLFMLATNWQEGLYFEINDVEYEYATYSYVKCVALFMTLFGISSYLSGGSPFSIKKNFEIVDGETKRQKKLANFYYIMCLVGVIFTLVYLILGGYEKLLLLSTNTDSWAFRITGYDDRSRFLIAMLEASRRILLPMGVVFLFLQWRLKGGRNSGIAVAVIAAFQILGAAMTLDRAPILLFFVQFAFVIICLGASATRILVVSVLGIVMLGIIAGITTFLQYNISTFSMTDVVEAGSNFIVHRTILVPSVASIELSFVQFPADAEKLMLAYSRLGALVGREYVGTEALSSLYVTPVGLVGDVWRNFGYGGIVVTGMLAGIFFGWMDRTVARVKGKTAIVHSFNSLSLACYFIFGVLFSQGVLFQIIVGALLLRREGRT